MIIHFFFTCFSMNMLLSLQSIMCIFFSFSLEFLSWVFSPWISQPHVLLTSFNSGLLSVSLSISFLLPLSLELSLWGTTVALIHSLLRSPVYFCDTIGLHLSCFSLRVKTLPMLLCPLKQTHKRWHTVHIFLLFILCTGQENEQRVCVCAWGGG